MSNKEIEYRGKFRHELKYRITSVQKDILVSRLNCFLQRDSNEKNGSYTIRSLYFDDYKNSAYEEKIMGTANRKKYRIRCYNYSDSYINLECKNKQGNYIYKESDLLTKEETEDILNGRYECLLSHKRDVSKRFYYECINNFMRPRVIVDYERIPYVFEGGNVRITIDCDIREVEFLEDLFDEKLPAYYVMPPEQYIMEVKYTEFLPDVIKDFIVTQEASLEAASKYVMCCDNKILRNGVLF